MKRINIIKHLSILYKVCSCFCIKCEKYRYKKYFELAYKQNKKIVIDKYTKCLKCGSIVLVNE